MIDYIEYLIVKYKPIDDTILDKYYNNFNKINYPFIISLEKDKNKYDNAFNNLKSLNFSPMKFKAIYGLDVEKYDSKIYNKFINLNNGEIGCFLSHLILYYLASKHKNQNQYTLIFEDDISTFANTSLLNKYINEALKYNGDIIYLGKCLEVCEQMKKISNNLYYGHKPLCLHAYLIKNSFAKKIINDFIKNERQQIDKPIDMYIHNSHDNKFGALIFHPSLFYQNTEFKSNLRSKHEQYSNLLECRESIYYTVYNYFFQKIDRINSFVFVILLFIITSLIIILYKKY